MTDAGKRLPCPICGEETEYPHTPIDHPTALGMRVHRMVRESKVAEAVAAERARIRAGVIASDWLSSTILRIIEGADDAD